MAQDPLGSLFERYRREEDLTALARVFEVVAPELLGLARHLRPRGQAPEDLVQTTFLAAITHRERYDARRPLRPWLLGILLHKAAGGRRQEQELSSEVLDPAPARDEALAAESAQLLARGLERLPPVYSEVLREHFFAGRAPGEIAQRLGRPPGTVRAQLHRGLRLLRGILPLGLAGWLVWLGPSRAALANARRVVLEHAAAQASLARPRTGPPPLAGARLVGAGLAVIAGVIAVRSWTPESPRGIAAERADAPRASAADGAAELPAPTSTARDAAAETGPSVAPQTRGELLVRVRFEDGSPASGVGLRIYLWGTPQDGRHREDGVTDEAGEYTVVDVPPGRVSLYCDRGGDQGLSATIAPGERAVRELELPQGVQVEGQVVDARGAPVARAGVWLSGSPMPAEGRIAARCDSLGRFSLRDVSPRRFLGARADGFAPSDVEWLGGGGLREGEATQLRLVLADAGGSVAGHVLDPSGAPLAGAHVVARAKGRSEFRVRADGALVGPAATIETQADAAGRFAIADLALEAFDLIVHAPGHPEWTGEARLSADTPHADVELRLSAAGSVRGTLRTPDGEPLSGVLVLLRRSIDSLQRTTDERGEYVFESVAPGRIELQANFGTTRGGTQAREVLALEPGGVARWDARVDRPREYAGRVLGTAGEPLAGAWVRAVGPLSGEFEEPLDLAGGDQAAWLFGWNDRYVRRQLLQVAADAEGRFTLSGVPAPFSIEVRRPDGRAGWPARHFEVAPPDGVLALSAREDPSASLSGTVVGPDGLPLSRGEVYAVRRSGGEARRFLGPGGNFRFENLPQGTFDLLVWSRGHRPRILGAVALEEGQGRELGEWRLEP